MELSAPVAAARRSTSEPTRGRQSCLYGGVSLLLCPIARPMRGGGITFAGMSLLLSPAARHAREASLPFPWRVHAAVSYGGADVWEPAMSCRGASLVASSSDEEARTARRDGDPAISCISLLSWFKIDNVFDFFC